MLKTIQKEQLSKFSYLVPFILILGVMWGVNINYPISYLALIITGSIAIILEFNFKIFINLFNPSKNKLNSIFLVTITIIITYILSFLAVLLGKFLGFEAVSNSVTNDLTVIKIIKVSISLIGEEIITTAIFLPIFNILCKKMSYKNSIILSLIISSILFGLMHFRAYNFHFYQMIVVIGLTRIPFSVLFIKTETLRTAIYAHIIYDLLLFILLIFR